jgi:hypothetical protein
MVRGCRPVQRNRVGGYVKYSGCRIDVVVATAHDRKRKSTGGGDPDVIRHQGTMFPW